MGRKEIQNLTTVLYQLAQALLSVGEVQEVLGKNHSITKPYQDCHSKIIRRVDWAALI